MTMFRLHIQTVWVLVSPLLLVLLAVNGQDLCDNNVIILKMGDTKNLTCNSTCIDDGSGYPDDQTFSPSQSDILYIIFEVEGRTVLQNSTRNYFTISYTDNTSVTHGGMYRCMVVAIDNGVTVILSNTSTMVVFSPVITKHPGDDVLTMDGDRIRLNCTAMGYPRPLIEWHRLVKDASLAGIATTNDIRALTRNLANNSSIQLADNTNNYTASSSLVISPVDFMGYGTYICLSILDYDKLESSKPNNSSFAYSITTLTVSPEGSVMVHPQTVNSTNGSTVTLSCSAGGGPDNTFNWIHLTTGKSNTSQSNQYNFTSTVHTAGDYQCMVCNGAGYDADNATVNVGPVITVSPRKGNVVNIRITKNLTCTAIGVPVPSITWVHNGSVINPEGEVRESENGYTIEFSNEESVGTVTSQLMINSSLLIHTGDYYCNATSPLEVYDPVMSSIAHLLDFPLVPEASPQIPSEAVPEDTRTPTSVLLKWMPLDYPGDDLKYNVTIKVEDDRYNTKSHKRQSLAPNSLEACLEAADISPVFFTLVPGDQTSLMVDVAPNVSYYFVVAGVTDFGSGPTSDRVGFSSPEGVPTAPRFVTLTNTSSTSLELKWREPICDNGMRIGYKITYRLLEGDTEELGNEPSPLTSIDVTATQQTFTGLMPNSTYEVVICALSRVGCGDNVTRNQTTNIEDDDSSPNRLLVAVLVPVLIILVITFVVILVFIVLVVLVIRRNKRKANHPLDVPDDSKDGLPDNIELEQPAPSTQEPSVNESAINTTSVGNSSSQSSIN